ncbi:hypothetical protein N8887_00200 [Candidatus Pelagibacter ubique]|nr:hypothetical protein [Candidatus Pelagibacter ubique]
MYKIIFNILIQVIVLILVFYNFREHINIDLIYTLFDINFFYILIYMSISKILIIFSFNYILTILSNKKLHALKIGEIILTGGLINYILPGVGFIYKYAKLKKLNYITLPQYAITQTIWSFNSLSAYAIFAILGGTIIIAIGKNTLYLALSLFVLLTIIIKLKFKIKAYLFYLSTKFKFIKNLIDTLSILKKNKMKLLKIYVIFILLVLIESFGFFLVLDYLSNESLDIIKTGYVYILSSLTVVILGMNYFGFFAAVSMVTSSLIMPDTSNIFINTFLFNFVNICSMILVLLILSLMINIKKN